MQKRYKKILINICVLLISGIISLLLMEILVRTFLPQRLENIIIDLFKPDKELGWRMIPNSHKRFGCPDFEMDVFIYLSKKPFIL